MMSSRRLNFITFLTMPLPNGFQLSDSFSPILNKPLDIFLKAIKSIVLSFIGVISGEVFSLDEYIRSLSIFSLLLLFSKLLYPNQIFWGPCFHGHC